MEELIIMVEYWWNSGGIWKQWRNINVIVPMKTNHIFTGMIAVSSPEANKEGVWFEYKGEMLVTGEKWTIVVEVNLTETRREIAELRGRTEDTAFLLTQAAEKLPSLGVQIKVLQRIMSMEDELMEIVQTLSDLYYGRSRRGLINLGGKILHVLFGVAENEDLEQVQHSEDLTKMKTASLIHIEEEHLTVTRELSRKAERNHQELGRVSQEVYENITSLMNHFLTTNRKTAELDNLLHVYMNTSTALEELELATFKALLDLRKIVQCLNDAANDKLSMNLISPLELRKILLKVRSSLPSGLELVFGTDISTVLKFYQLIKTCAVTSGEVIKILLTVPLSSIGRRFDMFQALALPVKNFHTNVTVRYQLDSSILLFSKDRDRYSTLQEAMLDQCNQVGSLTLCPAFSPLYARHEPSCLSSLFLGEVRLAQQHCTRLVLTKDPPDAWVWRQSDNSWIYSLSAERRFVSQCKAADQTTVEELTLHGTGVMQAIKGCTLSHPSYQIPAPTSLGGRTKVRLRPVAIDLPAALSLAGGRFSSSQIRLELARRQHQGHVWPGTSGVEEITIDNLFRSLQAMEAAEPTDELMNHWYYATAAVLVMALAGSAAAWKLYWKKAASTPSDDAEKESVPDPEVKTAQTHLNKTYKANVPLVLMNSFNTDDDTQKIIRKYKGLQVEIYTFNQSCFPRVAKETLLPVSHTFNIDSKLEAWYPPGHGDFYDSFHCSGLLQKFIQQGREYCFISNIDNLGATVDLNILNLLLDEKSKQPEFVMEVTDKTKADVKGGTLIQYENKLRLLEIAQVPKDHLDDFKSVKTFKFFNTNNLWIKLDAIQRVIDQGSLNMEVIVNHKSLENNLNVIQLETAVGAAMKCFNNGFGINVPRSRFLPVKKTSDLMLVMSNLYHLKSGSLIMSPQRMFPTTPHVKLGDNHFSKVRDFLSRFANIPDILELDHLTVSGDVTFGKNVSLRGTVIIIANHGDRIDIPSGAILENKIVSGNLRILDH